MAAVAMTVVQGFTEYEGGERVRRRKGEEITVTTKRADQLRAAGLARSKPKVARSKSDKAAKA